MAEGNISKLISSGFDAFDNLWDVTIAAPNANLGQGSEFTEISLRTASFSPPKVSIKTYPINYKGTFIERMSAQLEYKDNRELQLSFRLDGNFILLETLQKWKSLYYNASYDGNIRFGAYSSANLPLGTVTVRAYKTAGRTLNDLIVPSANDTSVEGAVWKFQDVALIDVIVKDLSREDSKPLSVDCLFMYGRLVEPYAPADSGLTPATNGFNANNNT